MKNLILGVLLAALGQSLIWFQINGQFVWPFFKKNPFLISLIFGTTISYVFIWSTHYIVTYYNGTVWESKLIAFGIGMLLFSIFTYNYLGEGLNMKTIVSIILATILVLIQFLWN